MGNQQLSRFSQDNHDIPKYCYTRIAQNLWEHTSYNLVVKENEIQIHNYKLNRFFRTQELRNHSPYLVKAPFYRFYEKDTICSDDTRGIIYIQVVSQGLGEKISTNFQNILHLYWKTLNGFMQLEEEFGPFGPEEEYIFLNGDQQIKIWLHSNLCEIEPVNRLSSEQQMLRQLLCILKRYTEKNQYFQILQHQTKNYTSFRNAIKGIKNVSNNLKIPIVENLKKKKTFLQPHLEKRNRKISRSFRKPNIEQKFNSMKYSAKQKDSRKSSVINFRKIEQQKKIKPFIHFTKSYPKQSVSNTLSLSNYQRGSVTFESIICDSSPQTHKFASKLGSSRIGTSVFTPEIKAQSKFTPIIMNEFKSEINDTNFTKQFQENKQIKNTSQNKVTIQIENNSNQAQNEEKYGLKKQSIFESSVKLNNSDSEQKKEQLLIPPQLLNSCREKLQENNKLVKYHQWQDDIDEQIYADLLMLSQDTI